MHLLIHTILQSGSHVAAARGMKAADTQIQELQIMFTSNMISGILTMSWLWCRTGWFEYFRSWGTVFRIYSEILSWINKLIWNDILNDFYLLSIADINTHWKTYVYKKKPYILAKSWLCFFFFFKWSTIKIYLHRLFWKYI